MTTLTIPIDSALAEAYDRATAAEREKTITLLSSFAEAMLRRALGNTLARGEQAEALKRVSDEAGAEARSNGWNDDLDAALLRGDFDHE